MAAKKKAPAGVPITVDDIGVGTVGTTSVIDVSANDDNSTCDVSQPTTLHTLLSKLDPVNTTGTTCAQPSLSLSTVGGGSSTLIGSPNSGQYTFQSVYSPADAAAIDIAWNFFLGFPAGQGWVYQTIPSIPGLEIWLTTGSVTNVVQNGPGDWTYTFDFNILAAGLLVPGGACAGISVPPQSNFAASAALLDSIYSASTPGDTSPIPAYVFDLNGWTEQPVGGHHPDDPTFAHVGRVVSGPHKGLYVFETCAATIPPNDSDGNAWAAGDPDTVVVAGGDVWARTAPDLDCTGITIPGSGCAVYGPTPLVDPASTATGIAATVTPAGVLSVDVTGPGTVILTVESGCSPSCDPTGADVATWVPQTVTVTFTAPVVPPVSADCKPLHELYSEI